MRVGSLFSGIGGLDLAVNAVFGGTTAWLSEIATVPKMVLEARFPGVPNVGDATQVDWTTMPPVDIIAGGSPCQDVSGMGSRRGLGPGTRSGLWAAMVDAVEALRPRYVVWENVDGVRHAHGTSNVGPCGVCLGDREGPALRALGRVLGDLSEVGYDAEWVTVPAIEAGAPHRRQRVFLLATDARRGGGARRSDIPGYGEVKEPDVALNRASDRAPVTGFPTATWGHYSPAIERWERVLGRPHPAPLYMGREIPYLTVEFVEWLMGFPEGWVSDVPTPGLSDYQARLERMEALGNSVVPHQAALALRKMIHV